MATLETRVSAGGPVTISADGVDPGEVVLAGPNRIPVMRTNKEGAGTPSSYQFVVLGNVANVSPGTLLYYQWDTEMYVVRSAELNITR